MFQKTMLKWSSNNIIRVNVGENLNKRKTLIQIVFHILFLLLYIYRSLEDGAYHLVRCFWNMNWCEIVNIDFHELLPFFFNTSVLPFISFPKIFRIIPPLTLLQRHTHFTPSIYFKWYHDTILHSLLMFCPLSHFELKRSRWDEIDLCLLWVCYLCDEFEI